MKYRLLDYFYTAFHCRHADSTPALNPLWFKYLNDTNTWSIDLQFLFGDSILVSPITQENVTHIEAYFLDECWGKKGLRTKVIGTVLLIQERKE